MALLNRASWWLLAYLASTSILALLVVAGAALLLHWSVPLAQTWLLCAGVVGYLLLHEGHAAPVAPPPPPPPPEPPVPLEDLEYLRRLWQHGDISEAVYRRAVDQATRRYVPPPPLPDPPRRRRRW